MRLCTYPLFLKRTERYDRTVRRIKARRDFCRMAARASFRLIAKLIVLRVATTRSSSVRAHDSASTLATQAVWVETAILDSFCLCLNPYQPRHAKAISEVINAGSGVAVADRLVVVVKSPLTVQLVTFSSGAAH